MHRPITESQTTNAAVAVEDSRKFYLDGLRGCAACVVLFSHLAIALNSPLLGMFNGNAAVCVFFVLSGYVLTDLSQRSDLTFPAQALRRYIRLVGPIFVTSTFACRSPPTLSNRIDEEISGCSKDLQRVLQGGLKGPLFFAPWHGNSLG